MSMTDGPIVPCDTWKVVSLSPTVSLAGGVLLLAGVVASMTVGPRSVTENCLHRGCVALASQRARLKFRLLCVAPSKGALQDGVPCSRRCPDLFASSPRAEQHPRVDRRDAPAFRLFLAPPAPRKSPATS